MILIIFWIIFDILRLSEFYSFAISFVQDSNSWPVAYLFIAKFLSWSSSETKKNSISSKNDTLHFLYWLLYAIL